MARLPLLVSLGSLAAGQLVGNLNVEMPPPVAISRCTVADGCALEEASATLDANWRWTHGMQCQGEGAMRQCYSSGDCYTSGAWDESICTSPEKCAEHCALEGVNAQQYESSYGVSAVPGGVELKFVSQGAGGMNVGSRLYLLGRDENYKMFKLKNREFTFDVDASELPCGLNGAVYFSEMPHDGGKGGLNEAGAKYGTGYCDAQCPHDIKFMGGVANTKDWNSTTALGALGACCTEMDLWEANNAATAYTPHPCTIQGTMICEGTDCGDTAKGERYDGVCDKDGCDSNSFRTGNKEFFGKGPQFTVDSSRPVTVVTQFITSDGTDEGDLVEIRRLYVQEGKVIENSDPTVLGESFVGKNSITDDFCAAQKEAFGDRNDFKRKGGLKRMGEALDRGMVLVMSLWDDAFTSMLWLDSVQGEGNRSTPGVARGPCSEDSGKPKDARGQHPDAYVRYSNIMYGEIGSTHKAGDQAKPVHAEAHSESYQARLEKFRSPMQPPAGAPPSPAERQTPPARSQNVTAGSPSSSECSAAYQQCGGKLWTGPTCCQDGCRCHGDPGGYYSQCTPPGGSWTCIAAPPVPGRPGAAWGTASDGAFMRKESARRRPIAGPGAAGLVAGSWLPVLVAAAGAGALMAAVGAVCRCRARAPGQRQWQGPSLYERLGTRELRGHLAGAPPQAEGSGCRPSSEDAA